MKSRKLDDWHYEVNLLLNSFFRKSKQGSERFVHYLKLRLLRMFHHSVQTVESPVGGVFGVLHPLISNLLSLGVVFEGSSFMSDPLFRDGIEQELNAFLSVFHNQALGSLCRRFAFNVGGADVSFVAAHDQRGHAIGVFDTEGLKDEVLLAHCFPHFDAPFKDEGLSVLSSQVKGSSVLFISEF